MQDDDREGATSRPAGRPGRASTCPGRAVRPLRGASAPRGSARRPESSGRIRCGSLVILLGDVEHGAGQADEFGALAGRVERANLARYFLVSGQQSVALQLSSALFQRVEFALVAAPPRGRRFRWRRMASARPSAVSFAR